MAGLPLPPSLWAATAPAAPETPPLAGDARAEVAIVGGGFTGLSTALHLAEAGTDALVIEAGEPGWGASGRNGGQVIPGTKYGPSALAELFGPASGARAADFAEGTAETLFALVRRHGIACEARQGGWIKAAHTAAGLAKLAGWADERKRRGSDVELLDREGVTRLLGVSGDAYAGGLLDRRGGSVQPLAYARGLAAAALQLGARIHSGTRAVLLEPDGSAWRIVTARGAVRAQHVLLATNAYSDDLWPGLKRTVIPLASAQIATAPLDERMQTRILREGHAASDTRRLLRYFRLDGAGRLVFGGRGALGSAAEAPAYRRLERALRRMFPMLADLAIEFRWSGLVALTLDAVPHISRLAPGLTAALGFNGHGVAMTTALGERLARYLTSDDAAHLPFPLQPPQRIPLHALRLPAIAAAVHYHRMRDAMRF